MGSARRRPQAGSGPSGPGAMAAPRWRRRASCWTPRRRGAAPRSSPPSPPAEPRAVEGMPPLERVIDEYLTYLRVERGVSPATVRAYGSDLADFAAARGTTAEWASGPEPAQRYLA